MMAGMPSTSLRLLPRWVAPAAVGAGVFAVGALAATVPPHGQAFYPRCPLYELTGVLCSGHFGAAAHDNLLLVAILPLLVVLWAAWLARAAGWSTVVPRLRWSPRLVTAVPLVMVAFGVLRNLPMHPFTALAPL
jgi:hypothetical protein